MTSIATARMTAAGGSDRSAVLGWLAGFTVLLYVVTSPVYLVGSLQIGDVWLAVVAAIILGSRTATLGVLRVFQGAYGVLALGLTEAMLLGALNARAFVHSLDSVAQLVFVLWILVPTVAAGIAAMDDPTRTCGQRVLRTS